MSAAQPISYGFIYLNALTLATIISALARSQEQRAQKIDLERAKSGSNYLLG
jgi:hypothetical protein